MPPPALHSRGDVRKDAEFRKFSSAVDRVLQSFDSVSEWADVIGFLTRLGKILQSFPQYSVVPKKLVVSKRLAQCLNPALPAGVHSKALEVYGLIFQAAGRSQLAEDLPLWSYGLFPFGSHAAMSAALLALYEKYYIPLGSKLRPGLKGLILAVLPMLEEEGNEYFEKALGIMDKISRAVEHACFFHAMWLAVISSPHHRQAAVHYLVRRLAKMSSGLEDMAILLGSHPELLSRALGALLSDKSSLVQRGALDLLLSNFPSDTSVFPKQDFEYIVTSAVGVVLRRDMSLNRRLYSWILGSAESPLSVASNNLGLIAETLKSMFYASDPLLSVAELSKPYRIAISLMDKPEIGPPVMDSLFIDIMRSLKLRLEQPQQHASEIFQVASMLLDSLDAFFIWKQLHALISGSADAETVIQNIELIMFMLDNFKLADDETHRVHLPFVYQTVATRLAEQPPDALLHPGNRFDAHLALCLKISETMHSEVFSNTWSLRDFRGVSIERRRVPVSGPASAFTSRRPSEQALGGTMTPISSGRRPSAVPNIITPSGSMLPRSAAHSPISSDAISLDSIVNVYKLAESSDAASHDWMQSIPVGKPSTDASLASLCKFSLQLANSPTFLDVAASHGESAGPRTGIRGSQADFGAVPILEAVSPRAYYLELWNALVAIFKHHLHVGSSFDCFDGVWLRSFIDCCVGANDFSVLEPGLAFVFGLLASEHVLRSNSSLAMDTALAESICGKVHTLRHLAQMHTSSLTRCNIAGPNGHLQLWSLLAPEHLVLHAQTAKLFQMFIDVVGVRPIEHCIVAFMLNGVVGERVASLNRFGVFWRQLEDAKANTSLMFARPLFVVFDALRNQNLELQLAGQNWIRSFVKSYARVVMPLLAILTHPDIRFGSSAAVRAAERIAPTRFLRPFNQAQVEYALSMLNTLLDFGSVLFLRSLWSVTAQQNQWISTACDWSLEDNQVPSASVSLSEALMILSCRFVLADYLDVEDPDPAELQAHLAIQLAACRLLQNMVSRSNALPPAMSLLIHDTVIFKLHACVVGCSLGLQPHLLATLSVVSAHVYQSHTFEQIHKLSDTPSDTSDGPLLVRTVLLALSLKSNRPILQHWFDVLFAHLPRFQSHFRQVIQPLLLRICTELRQCQAELHRAIRPYAPLQPPAPEPASRPSSRAHSRIPTASDPVVAAMPVGGHSGLSSALPFGSSSQPEIDTLILVYGLERMLAFCLQDDRGSTSDMAARPSATDAMGSILGFSSMIGTALVGEPASSTPSAAGTADAGPDATCRNEVLALLPAIFDILRRLCATLGSEPQLADGSASEAPDAPGDRWIAQPSIESTADRIRYRVRKLLESAYRMHSGSVVEALVEVWFAENDAYVETGRGYRRTSIAMLHMISGCTPKIAVATLVEGLRGRLPYLHTSSARERLKLQRPIADTMVVTFLEHYVSREVETDMLPECWSTLLLYIKEACVQASSVKYLFPPLLRLVHASFAKLSATSTFDDKRLRREAEDILQRLCDYCILIMGRAFDQGAWRRVFVGDVPDSIYRDERADMTGVRAPNPLEFASPARRTTRPSEDMMIQETVAYFAETLIPSLRQFVQDQDKMVGVLTNFIYYVAGPMLKSRHSMNKSFLNPVLDCICAMAQIPSAFKAFRKDVWEAFMDPRFFHMGALSTKKWQKIIHAVVSSDKERLADLFSRISATSSTTLFVSREQEFATRAHMLRRLSFVLLAGPVDFHHPQLPTIQEKIVEVFKSGSETLALEGFFCLRVLFCRVTAKHMATFWPTILSELVRTFSLCIRDAASDKPEDLAMLLAACKLLDMLLALGIEEFQIFQWLFVTETGDFLEQVASKAARPAGLVDKLGQRWAVLAISDGAVPAASPPARSTWLPSEARSAVGDSVDASRLGRPLILQRSIKSRSELDWFIRHISQRAYNCALDQLAPDTEFVDSLLEQEFPDVDTAAAAGVVNGSNGQVVGGAISGAATGAPVLGAAPGGLAMSKSGSSSGSGRVSPPAVNRENIAKRPGGAAPSPSRPK
ncbi:hypothetical protein HK105_205008 [Polyrhizophydium stewartii]|uniref:Dopey N-terminal domain-containing protein n=1 Tax=Polyrhizophydium stewartii TaxID=2732419 RepID=A0ABR4N783_9FUNG